MKPDEFCSKYNIILNAQQKSAVEHVDGQTLLLAVPGSGKTTVIVARTGYMIYCKGIAPQNILTVTYSKSAALDMKKRCISVFGDTMTDVDFRTIHSLCYSIIIYYSKTFERQPFTLMTDGQMSLIIREIYRTVSNEYLSELEMKEIKSQITYAENMMLSAEEIKKLGNGFDFEAFLKSYQQYKIKMKLMDYDDQLKFAYRILRDNKSVLSYFQDRYRYISVDEAQDTSKIQHTIINLLALKYKNIFMVGDEDQTIYGFRAAYPQALLNFDKVYPCASMLKMEENFRSTQSIVNAAQQFIMRNKNRYDKNMFTQNVKGVEIKHTVLENYNRQYNYLKSAACNATCQTAILFRNNESALPLVDIFESNGIDYYMREHDSTFFSHFVVRDIRAFIELSINPCDIDLFETIYYKVGAGIKKDDMALLRRTYNEYDDIFTALIAMYEESWKVRKIRELKKNFKDLTKLNSFGALNRILYSMGYNDYLNNQSTVNNEEIFRATCGTSPYNNKIRILFSLANQNSDVKLFLLRLSDLETAVQSEKEKNSRIVLSTIHSSKGLEYDKVIIIDIVDGIFPSFTLEETKDLDEDETETLEEDRRLFYVAVTRAKNELEIVSYKKEFFSGCDISFFTKQLLNVRSEKSKPLKKKTVKKVSDISLNDVYKEYQIGCEIVHCAYGKGKVVSIDKAIYGIEFSKTDTRKFDMPVCLANGIITKI